MLLFGKCQVCILELVAGRLLRRVFDFAAVSGGSETKLKGNSTQIILSCPLVESQSSGGGE
jgi:Holliday junction resolvasome RuvABC ATP-dependent DNA helicase subunit